MKATIKALIIVIATGSLFACNGNSNPGTNTNDSASVKRMSPDSNSDMPVHTPKDSTEKMPNPLDSVK